VHGAATLRSQANGDQIAREFERYLRRRGGASGMLAGRAVWTATLAADDPTQLLREHSVPRLQQLAAIVDIAHAADAFEEYFLVRHLFAVNNEAQQLLRSQRAQEEIVFPLREAIAGIESKRAGGDGRNPVSDRLIHALQGGVIADRCSIVVHAVTDNWPAVIVAWAEDIDFIAAYLLLRHGRGAQPANIRQRLYLLAEQGLINDADCASLDYSAEVLRTVDHVIRLVTGRTFKSLPPTEHGRAMTEQLSERLLQKQFSGGLESELRRLFASVREVFERLMV